MKDGTTGDDGEKLNGHVSKSGIDLTSKIWMIKKWKIWVKKDVLLLTDVFEKFINTCLKC